MKKIHPAHREDVAVQPGLQGNHQSGKPPLKHAQVIIGLPNHFLKRRNSIQEPDLWRRVCQRAGAVLRWIWTNSHCGFHYLWHECHHDFREGSHLKMHIFKIKIHLQVVSESESQESIGGKLSIAVNSIPGFSISGEGEINMDESNREFYESITCKV